jgi:CubicO group peptidase (beta-lactamase class C family)
MITAGNMTTRNMVDGIEESIAELMQEAIVPGLAITLIEKGSIAWSQSFGVRDRVSQDPITLDTVFEAASLSKPLFAYAYLKLCENSVLGLDTPLVEYVPAGCLSIALPTTGTSPERLVLEKRQLELITARHLLSHTAGLPNWPSKEQPLKIHFTPGERFAYSGMGYSLLQSIVEIITGRPAVEYVQENILEPFGMKNSRFEWTGQEDLPVALGHTENGEPAEKTLWLEMIAGASLHSTPIDFARFMLGIMGPSTDDPHHLSSELTKEMLTPQVKVNDSATWREEWPRPEITLHESVSWGLGWGIQHTATDDWFWHWGDNGNYQNFAIGSREEELGVVIMTNGRNGRQLYQRVVHEITGEEQPALDWLTNL